MTKNPLPGFEQLKQEFGDVVGLAFPGSRIVVLSHPDDIEAVMVAHGRSTGKGAAVKRVSRAFGKNIFVLTGDEHTRRRRIVSTIFRPRDIAGQVRWNTHDVDEMSSGFGGAASSEKAIDIRESLDLMTISAIGHVIYGGSLADHAQRIRQLSHDTHDGIPMLANPMFPVWGWLPLPAVRRVGRVAREFDDLCERLLDTISSGGDDEDSATIAARLLHARDEGGNALSREEVIQELRGFVIAGHDTTANALVWALQLLGHHPRVRNRLIEEVDRVVGDSDVCADDVPELRWTRAVVEESLRMYGGAFTIRSAEKDLQLSGFTVPKGTEILCAMWNVHHDERFWTSPDDFMPERFIEGFDDKPRPRMAYFPFGGGRRVCIGQHLGMQSTVVALAQLHRHWLLNPVGEFVEPTCNITVKPCGPVMMIPERRSLASG